MDFGAGILGSPRTDDFRGVEVGGVVFREDFALRHGELMRSRFSGTVRYGFSTKRMPGLGNPWRFEADKMVEMEKAE